MVTDRNPPEEASSPPEIQITDNPPHSINFEPNDMETSPASSATENLSPHGSNRNMASSNDGISPSNSPAILSYASVAASSKRTTTFREKTSNRSESDRIMARSITGKVDESLLTPLAVEQTHSSIAPEYFKVQATDENSRMFLFEENTGFLKNKMTILETVNLAAKEKLEEILTKHKNFKIENNRKLVIPNFDQFDSSKIDENEGAKYDYGLFLALNIGSIKPTAKLSNIGDFEHKSFDELNEENKIFQNFYARFDKHDIYLKLSPTQKQNVISIYTNWVASNTFHGKVSNEKEDGYFSFTLPMDNTWTNLTDSKLLLVELEVHENQKARSYLDWLSAFMEKLDFTFIKANEIQSPETIIGSSKKIFHILLRINNIKETGEYHLPPQTLTHFAGSPLSSNDFSILRKKVQLRILNSITKCTFCNSSSHQKSNCPITCSRCTLRGHHAEDCRTKEETINMIQIKKQFKKNENLTKSPKKNTKNIKTSKNPEINKEKDDSQFKAYSNPLPSKYAPQQHEWQTIGSSPKAYRKSLSASTSPLSATLNPFYQLHEQDDEHEEIEDEIIESGPTESYVDDSYNKTTSQTKIKHLQKQSAVESDEFEMLNEAIKLNNKKNDDQDAHKTSYIHISNDNLPEPTNTKEDTINSQSDSLGLQQLFAAGSQNNDPSTQQDTDLSDIEFASENNHISIEETFFSEPSGPITRGRKTTLSALQSTNISLSPTRRLSPIKKIDKGKYPISSHSRSPHKKMLTREQLTKFEQHEKQKQSSIELNISQQSSIELNISQQSSLILQSEQGSINTNSQISPSSLTGQSSLNGATQHNSY
ncbi:hypothetical protein WICMUC_001166 [Wickerhamomyces mucosus]|uniref:CCHC-type domain-containing protein n=1 Tax=Wickerhamomyces mucosus TaxID=1378264 RepID=A0A9P8PX34_9ASCO|nr:hypothetical protein WICMUC_001166 [Wickerhamomyces mucosus]